MLQDTSKPPVPTPDPVPATPAPQKKRKYGWKDWCAIIFILLVIAAIAIPNFVKARMTACKSACIANLKQIDGATQQWALEGKKAGNSPVATSDVLAFLKGNALPVCPANGTYSLSTVSSAPTCSAKEPGHSL